MTDNIENILKNITDKAKKLKDRNARLEQEVKTLREDVFKHLATIAALKEAAKENETLNLANDLGEKVHFTDKEIKAQIDKYIRLIDKTVSGLKNTME